jgi:putative SOS response-associated peptidase YedK
MCGRYTIRELELLRAGLGIARQTNLDDFVERRILPTFNAAPSQTLPIIRTSHDGSFLLEMAKWGFVPSWTKGKPKLAPINAKCETAATSGMFRKAFSQRRCLIPADGFYEPKGPKTQKNRPWFFFQMKDKSLFAFGGLWERWYPEPEKPLDTFTILTTTPNKLVGQIHDRQPVIIDKDDYEKWLDPKTPTDEVVEMTNAIDEGKLEAWPVSNAAKAPANNGEELIEPIGSKI